MIHPGTATMRPSAPTDAVLLVVDDLDAVAARVSGVDALAPASGAEGSHGTVGHGRSDRFDSPFGHLQAVFGREGQISSPDLVPGRWAAWLIESRPWSVDVDLDRSEARRAAPPRPGTLLRVTNARPGGSLSFVLALAALTLIGVACGQASDDGSSTALPEAETVAAGGSTTTTTLVVSSSAAQASDDTADDADSLTAETSDQDRGSEADARRSESDTSPGSSSTPATSAATPSSSQISSGSTATSASTTASTSATASTTATTVRTTVTDPPTTATAPPTTVGRQVQCLVRLHGKSGRGGSTDNLTNEIRQLRPQGNSEAWGGYQWLYFPEPGYAETVGIVAAAVDAEGCTDVVINGFSNGGAFAGKLYCRGETFGGRLRGVIIDDPVPDGGTASCDPPGGVQRVLYWTGGLANQAPAGTDCGRIDWTCDGGSSVGIDAYAQRLGAPVTPSPFNSHQWHWNAPEVTSFFD